MVHVAVVLSHFLHGRLRGGFAGFGRVVQFRIAKAGVILPPERGVYAASIFELGGVRKNQASRNCRVEAA
jgi:hypothetical protein